MSISPIVEEGDARSVSVDGLSIAYRVAGSGPAIVLLHGAFQDGRYWARELREWSDRFTVIAVDAPGFGRSDDPPGAWATADYGKHLGAVLDTLGVDQPTVLGLSFGSVYALALYQQRPDAVGALVLVSAYAGWAGSLPAAEVQRRVEQSERELSGPVEDIIAHWLPTLLTDAASAGSRELVTTMMREFRPTGMRAAVHALGAVDLRPMLPTIMVPTLLVYGAADVRAPADPVGVDVNARIPRSELVVIPDAPHLVNLEKPVEFDAAVRPFASSWVLE